MSSLYDDSAAMELVTRCRNLGWGYKKVHRELNRLGYAYGRDIVQHVCQHLERNIQSSIDSAIDAAEVVVGEDFFSKRGIEEPPEGFKFVAGTIEMRGPEGEKHWLRVRPESEEGEEAQRVEIRQAQPVVVEGRPSSLTTFSPGNWEAWAIVPDCQIGYWLDSEGTQRTTHDERAFSLGHQIMAALAESEGLHGILDVGDHLDLSCFSRWNPTAIDLAVSSLNRTWQRASEEAARRRWLVGEEGEVVILSGNHDARIQTFLNKAAPWVVGMKRPGDEDDWPVMSVPYLIRAKDYGVEWVDNFPGSYRLLNSHLVAMHSPSLGSKPFDTARKIASTIHASVVHGHTHRAESADFNLETTDKGVRTFSVFSSGCWARVDGSLPSGKNSFDSYGNRILASRQPANTGMLSENFHQGMDIVWVEKGGQERWSREHISFWGPWGMWRGVEFHAQCDEDGNPLTESVLAAA